MQVLLCACILYKQIKLMSKCENENMNNPFFHNSWINYVNIIPNKEQKTENM